MKLKPLQKNLSSPKKGTAAGQSSVPVATSKKTGDSVKSPEGNIAQRAYFMYIDQGCPQGMDIDHWLKAEAEIPHN
ncbi:MAG: DUF2934 domain-containing protein [Opitutales bacterium]|nr:DUF2934 domain-containing protein [Opitutales bacterium]MCH8541639.1 DUF2934 domain-containing protein [Opitutales bacterium]